tara:strand:+ start:563 stop:883 length:321 start_codon:yes stop_codon:yes gene_type:complete
MRNQRLIRLCVGLLLGFSAASYAHHSFAPFDIRNPIVIEGIAEDFVYRRPHPKLSLVDKDDVTWDIEVPIRRWERAKLAPDLIEPGDAIERGEPLEEVLEKYSEQE